MPYFRFRCAARATFDRNLIHSADACFLFMACVGYSRVQLKTLSSLLKCLSTTSNVIVLASDIQVNHKSYNFLNCDWFKKRLFPTNSLVKLLSDSLLSDSLLSDSLLSDSSTNQSNSKL